MDTVAQHLHAHFPGKQFNCEFEIVSFGTDLRKLIVRCECLDVHKSMQLTFCYNPQANDQQDDAAEIDDD